MVHLDTQASEKGVSGMRTRQLRTTNYNTEGSTAAFSLPLCLSCVLHEAAPIIMQLPAVTVSYVACLCACVCFGPLVHSRTPRRYTVLIPATQLSYTASEEPS